MLNDCTVLIQMQVQYEDSLIVEYDTPHTFFRVPALTLQPIVENSVKHGRGVTPMITAIRVLRLVTSGKDLK